PPAPSWSRSRAHIDGYGRSLRPPQGTSTAPRRRAVFRQTLLDPGRQLVDEDVPLANLVEHEDAVRDKWVPGDDPSGFVGSDAFEQAHRARIVGEGAAHHKRPVLDQGVDELGVRVPIGLLANAAARPGWARSPDDDNSLRHRRSAYA